MKSGGGAFQGKKTNPGNQNKKTSLRNHKKANVAEVRVWQFLYVLQHRVMVKRLEL